MPIPTAPGSQLVPEGDARGDADVGVTATRFESGFLPQPAEPDPGAWPVGARFGSIRVIRGIAVGGMGEVFEGFDESLRRRVALKALRQDRLSPQARARLLHEARVLSQLSDPRICGVYGWIDDPGGEFLVLELIEGETLEGYFAKGQPRTAALRIAADLAEVLAASHRKGVIHRDLKPSNLMLTRAGRLKVLDFGISSVVELPNPAGDESALDLGPEDEALRSRAGSIVGTIHYMSPEQARGERVTAASDMYSFGILLEELLTGRKPHQDAPGLLQILVRLQKGERPAPQGLPPELAELILALTAVAPEARPSAADVVARLAAIRDAPRRRLRRAATGLALVAVLAAGLWHSYRLTVERNAAREAERRALASHREAEEMVAFLESMFAGADPTETDGRNLTVREVLDRGAERIRESLADQPSARARLLATIGRAYLELGLLDRADAVLGEALAATEKLQGDESPASGEVLAALAVLRREQDRHGEARDLLLRALEIARSADAAASDGTAEASGAASGAEGRFAPTSVRLLELANTESRLALFDSAEARIREALAIRERTPDDRAGIADATVALANLLRNRGRYGEAYELYRRALELEDPKRSLHGRGNLRYNTGITLSQLGRFDEAESMLGESLETWTAVYGEGHGNVAKVELALATIDRKKERWKEAERRYRKVLAIWEKTHGPASTNVAFGLNNLGNLYLEQGDLKRAEPAYREALAIFEAKAGKDHPNVAMSLANLARCLGGQGRQAEAVAHLRRVVAIGEKSGGPASVDLAWDRLFLAQALWRQSGGAGPAAAEARAEAERGLAILTPALGAGNSDLAEVTKETPELFRGLAGG